MYLQMRYFAWLHDPRLCSYSRTHLPPVRTVLCIHSHVNKDGLFHSQLWHTAFSTSQLHKVLYRVVQRSPDFHITLWAGSGCTLPLTLPRNCSAWLVWVGHFIPVSAVPNAARLAVTGFGLAPFILSWVVWDTCKGNRKHNGKCKYFAYQI